MGDYSNIIELIEKHVSKQVEECIAEFAQNLANRYKMDFHDILACAPSGSSAASSPRLQTQLRCKGICGTGKNKRQCSRNAQVGDSYCKSHKFQGEELQRNAPVKISTGQHNHPLSVLFKADCPGCMANKSTNHHSTVIDLGLLK